MDIYIYCIDVESQLKACMIKRDNGRCCLTPCQKIVCRKARPARKGKHRPGRMSVVASFRSGGSLGRFYVILGMVRIDQRQ